MNEQRFNELIAKRIGKCTDVLVNKAFEYAHPEDRLHNFKVAAKLQGISPREAIRGMMSKHTVSIYDMCANDRVYSDELWDEKLTDSINYLFLLEAIVADEAAEKLAETRQRIRSDLDIWKTAK